MATKGQVRIGWLEDNIGYTGGAEMSSATLRKHAPEGVEIVLCPPNYRPPEDIDAYVIQNCTTYKAYWVEELALKPVIKQIRDPWYAGSSLLRRWLLQNAEILIFSSPVQVDHFEYQTDLCYKLVPPPVDLEQFREAAVPPRERHGNIFVGRCDIFKGAHVAVDWAIHNSEPLDLYGPQGFGSGKFLEFGKLPANVKFHGQVPYVNMPAIMGRAKRFIAMPSWPEAFGRTTAEAWTAGCELLVRPDKIGACWWIKNDPEALEHGVEMFWEAVGGVL